MTRKDNKKKKIVERFGMVDDAAAKLDRPPFTNANKWDAFKTLDMEAQAIGFFLSSHPLDPYKEELAAMPILRTIADFHDIAESQEKQQQQAKKKGERKKRPDPTRLACIITDKREVKTKKGDRMGILSIADLTGTDEVAVFPKDFVTLDEKCNIGTTVFMDVELGLDGDRLRINAKEVSELDGSLNKDKRVTLKLDIIDSIDALKDAWEALPEGDTTCQLVYRASGLGEVHVALPKGISFGKRARSQFEAIAGVTVL